MKISIAIICFTSLILLASNCNAGARKTIQFPPGSVSAIVEESVIRGERDVYFLTARAGQIMEVNISAVEDNAAFQIYQPGAKAKEKDGYTEVSGKPLAGAGEADDASAWKGRLPVSGKYLIVVGGTRGNATYKLQVTVR